LPFILTSPRKATTRRRHDRVVAPPGGYGMTQRISERASFVVDETGKIAFAKV
jgi:peroxiredoxin